MRQQHNVHKFRISTSRLPREGREEEDSLEHKDLKVRAAKPAHLQLHHSKSSQASKVSQLEGLPTYAGEEPLATALQEHNCSTAE